MEALEAEVEAARSNWLSTVDMPEQPKRCPQCQKKVEIVHVDTDRAVFMCGGEDNSCEWPFLSGTKNWGTSNHTKYIIYKELKEKLKKEKKEKKKKKEKEKRRRSKSIFGDEDDDDEVNESGDLNSSTRLEDNSGSELKSPKKVSKKCKTPNDTSESEENSEPRDLSVAEARNEITIETRKEVGDTISKPPKSQTIETRKEVGDTISKPPKSQTIDAREEDGDTISNPPKSQTIDAREGDGDTISNPPKAQNADERISNNLTESFDTRPKPKQTLLVDETDQQLTSDGSEYGTAAAAPVSYKVKQTALKKIYSDATSKSKKEPQTVEEDKTDQGNANEKSPVPGRHSDDEDDSFETFNFDRLSSLRIPSLVSPIRISPKTDKSKITGNKTPEIQAKSPVQTDLVDVNDDDNFVRPSSSFSMTMTPFHFPSILSPLPSTPSRGPHYTPSHNLLGDDLRLTSDESEISDFEKTPRASDNDRYKYTFSPKPRVVETEVKMVLSRKRDSLEWNVSMAKKEKDLSDKFDELLLPDRSAASTPVHGQKLDKVVLNLKKSAGTHQWNVDSDVGSSPRRADVQHRRERKSNPQPKRKLQSLDSLHDPKSQETTKQVKTPTKSLQVPPTTKTGSETSLVSPSRSKSRKSGEGFDDFVLPNSNLWNVNMLEESPPKKVAATDEFRSIENSSIAANQPAAPRDSTTTSTVKPSPFRNSEKSIFSIDDNQPIERDSTNGSVKPSPFQSYGEKSIFSMDDNQPTERDSIIGSIKPSPFQSSGEKSIFSIDDTRPNDSAKTDDVMSLAIKPKKTFTRKSKSTPHVINPGFKLLPSLTNRLTLSTGISVTISAPDMNKTPDPEVEGLNKILDLTRQFSISPDEDESRMMNILLKSLSRRTDDDGDETITSLMQVQKSLKLEMKSSDSLLNKVTLHVGMGKSLIDLPQENCLIDVTPKSNDLQMMLTSDSDGIEINSLKRRWAPQIVPTQPVRKRGRPKMVPTRFTAECFEFGENAFGENSFGETSFGENPFGENPFGENSFGEMPISPPISPSRISPVSKLKTFLSDQTAVSQFFYYLNIMMQSYKMPPEWAAQGIDPVIAMMTTRSQDPAYASIDFPAMLHFYSQVVRHYQVQENCQTGGPQSDGSFLAAFQSQDVQLSNESMPTILSNESMPRTLSNEPMPRTLSNEPKPLSNVPTPRKLNKYVVSTTTDTGLTFTELQPTDDSDIFLLQSPNQDESTSMVRSNSAPRKSNIKDELILPVTPSHPDSVCLQSVRPGPRSVMEVPPHMPGTGVIGKGRLHVSAKYCGSLIGPIMVDTDEEVKAVSVIIEQKLNERRAKDETGSKKNVFVNPEVAYAKKLLSTDVLQYLERATTLKGLLENSPGRRRHNYPKRSRIIEISPVTGELIYPQSDAAQTKDIPLRVIKREVTAAKENPMDGIEPLEKSVFRHSPLSRVPESNIQQQQRTTEEQTTEQRTTEGDFNQLEESPAKRQRVGEMIRNFRPFKSVSQSSIPSADVADKILQTVDVEKVKAKLMSHQQSKTRQTKPEKQTAESEAQKVSLSEAGLSLTRLITRRSTRARKPTFKMSKSNSIEIFQNKSKNKLFESNTKLSDNAASSIYGNGDNMDVIEDQLNERQNSSSFAAKPSAEILEGSSDKSLKEKSAAIQAKQLAAIQAQQLAAIQAQQLAAIQAQQLAAIQAQQLAAIQAQQSAAIQAQQSATVKANRSTPILANPLTLLKARQSIVIETQQLAAIKSQQSMVSKALQLDASKAPQSTEILAQGSSKIRDQQSAVILSNQLDENFTKLPDVILTNQSGVYFETQSDMVYSKQAAKIDANESDGILSVDILSNKNVATPKKFRLLQAAGDGIQETGEKSQVETASEKTNNQKEFFFQIGEQSSQGIFLNHDEVDLIDPRETIEIEYIDYMESQPNQSEQTISSPGSGYNTNSETVSPISEPSKFPFHIRNKRLSHKKLAKVKKFRDENRYKIAIPFDQQNNDLDLSDIIQPMAEVSDEQNHPPNSQPEKPEQKSSINSTRDQVVEGSSFDTLVENMDAPAMTDSWPGSAPATTDSWPGSASATTDSLPGSKVTNTSLTTEEKRNVSRDQTSENQFETSYKSKRGNKSRRGRIKTGNTNPNPDRQQLNNFLDRVFNSRKSILENKLPPQKIKDQRKKWTPASRKCLKMGMSSRSSASKQKSSDEQNPSEVLSLNSSCSSVFIRPTKTDKVVVNYEEKKKREEKIKKKLGGKISEASIPTKPPKKLWPPLNRMPTGAAINGKLKVLKSNGTVIEVETKPPKPYPPKSEPPKPERRFAVSEEERLLMDELLQTGIASIQSFATENPKSQICDVSLSGPRHRPVNIFEEFEMSMTQTPDSFEVPSLDDLL